jgi:hypothetical protein
LVSRFTAGAFGFLTFTQRGDHHARSSVIALEEVRQLDDIGRHPARRILRQQLGR